MNFPEKSRQLYNTILEVIRENGKDMNVKSVRAVLKEIDYTIASVTGYVTINDVWDIARKIRDK